MTAVYYQGSGRFTVGRGEVRRPADGEVRLDVAYCGLCGTDLHIARGSMDNRVKPPQVIGHEMSGTVAEIAAQCGTDAATYTRERPGMSAFVLEDGVVYHTYSTYSRGLDALWGMYQWLDRAPRGRNETGVWWRRHDEYDRR